jgi:alpha-D-ribose 1-methylphosphonate 5-triphosphate synthase subunit PhnH
VQPGVAVFAILDDYSKLKDIKRVEEGEVREDEKVLTQIEEIKKGEGG